MPRERARRAASSASCSSVKAIKRTNVTDFATIDDQPEKLGLSHRRLHAADA
jgi:hypothetical protein